MEKKKDLKISSVENLPSLRGSRGTIKVTPGMKKKLKELGITADHLLNIKAKNKKDKNGKKMKIG